MIIPLPVASLLDQAAGRRRGCRFARRETGQPDGRKLDSFGVESLSLPNSCLSRVKCMVSTFDQAVELKILLLGEG